VTDSSGAAWSDRASTHELAFADGLVMKRFRSHRRDEHRREWAGLQLVHRYAPGLAPRPVRCELDSEPPTITMTWLPGNPLGRAPLTTGQLVALADALDRLHTAVPLVEAAALPPVIGHPVGGLVRLRNSLDGQPRDRAEPTIAEAVTQARLWLHSADAGRTADLGSNTPVLGRGDHNLPNFILDGDSIRLVDFEDSGRSDPAIELAALVEHQAARGTPDPNGPPAVLRRDAAACCPPLLRRISADPATAGRALPRPQPTLDRTSAGAAGAEPSRLTERQRQWTPDCMKAALLQAPDSMKGPLLQTYGSKGPFMQSGRAGRRGASGGQGAGRVSRARGPRR